MPACLAPDELLFAEKSGVSRRPLDHTTEPTGGTIYPLRKNGSQFERTYTT